MEILRRYSRFASLAPQNDMFLEMSTGPNESSLKDSVLIQFITWRSQNHIATDDPEGEQVYQSLLDYEDDRIRIISREDTALVNALQSRAAVVLQKSIREGFGLTVTEAMWKRAAVIGGKVGGIRTQIEDGVNGFLVSSVEEAAKRIVQLVKDEDLRHRMGEKARETVRQRFLMIRLLEQHLDLLNSFETTYKLHAARL
jgi:trehalose synthase